MRKKVTIEMMREALIASRPWNCSEEDFRNHLEKLSDEQLEETDICRELKFESLDLTDLAMRLETDSGHELCGYHDITTASSITVRKIINICNN